MRYIIYIISILLLSLSLSDEGYSKEYLFILAGQSNMAFLNPDTDFTPIVERYYGVDNIDVVFDAFPGQPIKEWKVGCSMWESLTDKLNTGNHYNNVVFIWMQGESDAKRRTPDNYKRDVLDLFGRVSDLYPDSRMSFVVGRISDWYISHPEWTVYRPSWMGIRKAQEELGMEYENVRIVNTDDLNGSINDMHFVPNYGILGKRFADAAISMNPKVNIVPIISMLLLKK